MKASASVVQNQRDVERRYKWYLVGMLWCVSFFNYADRQAIFSLFPLISAELRLSPVQLGLLGSAFGWLYGLAAPLAGRIVDSIRRKTAILFGLQVWSVICAATALSGTFRQLLCFRAAEGLGESLYYPASMSLISDYHGKRTRSRAMGLHQTSIYFGTVVGGLFAGLLGQHFGWRISFLVFGGAGIALGLILRRSLHEGERGSADGLDQPAASTARIDRPRLFQFALMVIRTPAVMALMGAFAFANFGNFILLSWMPTFLYQDFRMSLWRASGTATLYVQFASMGGAAVGGWLADEARKKIIYGRVLVQAVGVLASAPFVAICGRTSSVLWLSIALTAWGFFKGIYDANIFASLFEVVPAEVRGTAAGILNAVGWVVGASSAFIVGMIAEAQSLRAGILLASLVYVAAGVLLLWAIVCFIQARLTAGTTPRRELA